MKKILLAAVALLFTVGATAQDINIKLRTAPVASRMSVTTPPSRTYVLTVMLA